ncbi:hypothetical protein GCM10022262_42980 [Georgenia daeguensis]|uniref:Carrier domain-containing protein n=2 Tax=Georgenia daeguensis TaxID=908355 RepID=A0ABP6US16_9MICO
MKPRVANKNMPAAMNRSAELLPEPDFGGVSGRAPRTAREEILCGLFARLLGAERVGVEDNFFSLGGDSILSIQVSSRARQSGLRLATKELENAAAVSDLLDKEQGTGQNALELFLTRAEYFLLTGDQPKAIENLTKALSEPGPSVVVLPAVLRMFEPTHLTA